MFKQRKMLAMIFLLFLIVASLMFSVFFTSSVEGMSTDVETDEMTEEDMFKKLSGDDDEITLTDFKTLLEKHPELKTLLKTKLMESNGTTSSSESFQTDNEPSEETGNEPSEEISGEPSEETSNQPSEETGNEPSEETSNSTESFITRLTPSEFSSTSSNLTPTQTPVIPTKPNNVGVYNRVFEFSNSQPFQLKGP